MGDLQHLTLNYSAYVRREVPPGPRRARKPLTPCAAKSAHAEYLALTSVVRNGVDVAKRARADGFRARIEDLMVSGQAAEDGSLRVLRAALTKADKQRAQLRQEEKRVSRARAKMRIMEDTYLINHASEEVRELQKNRTGLTHLRLQAYCALRSQLQVERAISRLGRVLADLSALLKALVEEYDQVRTHTRGPFLEGESVASTPSIPIDEHQEEEEPCSMTSYGVMDNSDYIEEPRNDVLNGSNYKSHSLNRVIDGSNYTTQPHKLFPDTDRDVDAFEPPSIAKLNFFDRSRKPNSLRRDRRQPAHSQYDGVAASAQESSSRLFRTRLWSRPLTLSERADSELVCVQNSDVDSESLLRSEPSVRRERSIPIFSQVRSSVKATRALSRFTMARVRLPSAAKKMWVEIDERYSSILGLAPHLIERRLVPLESIEEGLLGPWPQRERNVSGLSRVEKMVTTVDGAIEAVDGVSSWQTSLVSTIREDYRKHRDELRATEAQISDIYVQQITGLDWNAKE